MRAAFLLLVVMLWSASTAYSARDLASFLRASHEEPKLAACGPECKLCACALIYPPNPDLCFCVKKVDPAEELRGEKSSEMAPLMLLDFTRFAPKLAACGPDCKACICPPPVLPPNPGVCICLGEESSASIPAMNAKMAMPEDRAIVLPE